MNCQEALQLLYDIIDREASTIDSEQVKAHLSHCKDCGDVYQIESAIQEFITMKLKANTPAPKLDVLKTRILKSLGEIDCSDRG